MYSQWMRRIERRLFVINDEIESLEESLRLVEEELTFHQHLNDDAQRDAVVSGNPLDRSDARQTGGDVRRFERNLMQVRQRKAALQAKRDRLVKRL
jgi:hypothetical protein